MTKALQLLAIGSQPTPSAEESDFSRLRKQQVDVLIRSRLSRRRYFLCYFAVPFYSFRFPLNSPRTPVTFFYLFTLREDLIRRGCPATVTFHLGVGVG